MKSLCSLAAVTTLTFTGLSASAQNYSSLNGAIAIDGSSTVYPITEAISEEFGKLAPRLRITVGISGTGGGFKRFTVGDTDISDASRPIKAKEAKAAAANGIEFIELPVAFDGLSIVVNKDNDWVDALTIDDLRKIFLDGSKVKTWKDLRPQWPAETVKIYAPGTDSGTFDYFKEVVAGDKGSIRSDMSVSEDDNVLVRGVAGEKGSIGFFGCAYYFENQDKLRVVPIVNPSLGSPVTPSSETIVSGEYAPFSRPLFIYVNLDSARKRNVRAFVEYYLRHAAQMAGEVGYVRLPDSVYAVANKNFKTKKTGTHFLDENGEKISGSVTDLFK